jgi:hypothetical protein
MMRGPLQTGIFAYGLPVRIERKLGLGPDSLVVLIVYIAGVLLLTEVPG